MKTVVIRLPDVEAAMLVKLLKNNYFSKSFRGALKRLIEREYCKCG